MCINMYVRAVRKGKVLEHYCVFIVKKGIGHIAGHARTATTIHHYYYYEHLGLVWMNASSGDFG